MNGYDQHDINIAQQLGSIEAKLDNALAWQQKHEAWSQERSAEIDTRLNEHDRKFTFVKGVQWCLAVLWAIGVAIWDRFHR